MTDELTPWQRFIWVWGKIADVIQGEVQYQHHLAEAAPGTPLAHAMQRVMNGDPSAQDLIDFARWEIWDAIMSLDPWVPRDRGPGWEPRHGQRYALPRIQDGFHAGCCASRAEGALQRLEKLLKEIK